jgi:hypothetical protein
MASVLVVAAEEAPPLPVTHHHWNFLQGPLTNEADGGIGVSGYRNPSSPICANPTSAAANVNIDCEGKAPHNETAIAVNPTDSNNIIGGANDYQLRLTGGGTVWETAFSRAHVSKDGGQTWTTYPIPFNGYISTGDPGIAFDANGTAYYSTLGFLWSQNIGCCTNPDVVVSTSKNGGVTWSAPARAASGTGWFTSVGKLWDKESITAWGNGNAIVTMTLFNDGIGGSYISSPIYASVTHDSGATWSKPVSISGSAAFCVGAQGGTTCNQDQGSVPSVGADGFIYVSFMNFAQPTTTGRDQYLVVKVDATTGQRVAGPYKVGLIYDGFTDYPLSIDGRQTYHDSQFRSWAFGAIAADPTTAGHLAVVWSDMRNSTLPAPADPYTATTNSDIIVSQSFDGGATWSAPAALTIVRDQFQPWAVYDTNGLLRIGYFDRSYDAANHKYGYTLATESGWGTLTYAKSQLTNVLSDPTQGDRWFSGRTPNAAFPHPTTFLGDYSAVANDLGGGVVALWTDMRNNVCFGGRCGAGEDAFFAAAP